MGAAIFDPVGPQEMLQSELTILSDLVRSSGADDVLEIGMANGSSTLAILSVLRSAGRGHLTSIDPFQLAPVDASAGMMKGFGGGGVKRVVDAGLADLHSLVPLPDYVALPQLVESGKRFDFILIDGYHSFDFTMLDFFYADLLLRPGGHIAFHDSACAAVFKVCQFVVRNKPYQMIGPPPALVYRSLTRRLARRLLQVFSGKAAEFRERRNRWKSLAVFVKKADRLADQFVAPGI